jgi:drug/metabolite transporter, DME family
MRERLLILAAAVLWSTAGVGMKLSALSGWQLASGRSLFAALALALLLPAARAWPSRRVLLVSVAYAGTVVLFALANKLTTAANAIFLQDTAPLYVLGLSVWLLRERPSRGELAAVPLFLAGLTMFFLDQLAPGQLEGNLIALLAGVFFAACITGLRWVGAEGPAVLLWGNVLAALLGVPWALEGAMPAAADWAILAFLGTFQLALAYVLFQAGLRRTPALEASLLILLEPILNPLWTFLFAGERPGSWALVGGALILAGTVWRLLASAAAPAAIASTRAG